jgi:hypothetical protein
MLACMRMLLAKNKTEGLFIGLHVNSLWVSALDGQSPAYHACTLILREVLYILNLVPSIQTNVPQILTWRLERKIDKSHFYFNICI